MSITKDIWVTLEDMQYIHLEREAGSTEVALSVGNGMHDVTLMVEFKDLARALVELDGPVYE